MSKQKLTPWFDGSVKPKRRGVYKRRVNLGVVGLTFFALFDGRKWRVGQNDPYRAADEPFISVHQDDGQWRGLAQKPA